MYKNELQEKIEEGRKLKETVQSRQGNDKIAEEVIKRNEQKKSQSSDYQIQIIDKVIQTIRSADVEQDSNGPNSLSSLIKKIDHVNYYSSSGELPLIAAVEGQYSSNVKFLIQNGALLDLKDKRGKTALMKAVELGKIHLIDELLSAGANKNITDSDGNSLLHLAVFSKNIECFLKIISVVSNINLQNNNGDTVLHVAAAIGNRDLLQNIYTQPSINKMIFNNFGYLPIHNAAINGHVNIVEDLIKNFYTVDALTKDNKTTLICAVIFNQSLVIDKLIAIGANPKLQDSNNKGVLEYATEAKNSNLTALLQEYITKFETNEANNLIQTREKSFYSAMEVNFLLKYMLKLDMVMKEIISIDNSGTTVLHLIAALGYCDLLEVILRNTSIKEYINIKDMDGNSIISAALLGTHYIDRFGEKNQLKIDKNISNNERIKVVKILLENGIDLKLENNNHEAPIFIAIATNNLAAIKEIILHDRSNLSLKNKDNMSLLHYATYLIKPAIIEYLVHDCKFDLYQIDAYNRNILDLANIMLKSPEFADHNNTLKNIIKYYIDLGLAYTEVNLQYSNFYLNGAIAASDMESLKRFQETKYSPIEAAKVGDIKALQAYIRYGYNYLDEKEKKIIIENFEKNNMGEFIGSIYHDYVKSDVAGEICITDE